MPVGWHRLGFARWTALAGGEMVGEPARFSEPNAGRPGVR
jgi:hypothetical protein